MTRQTLTTNTDPSPHQRLLMDQGWHFPPTRPVTIAMNGNWGSPVSQTVDVQGCNYFIQDYDAFHPLILKTYPMPGSSYRGSRASQEPLCQRCKAGL